MNRRRNNETGASNKQTGAGLFNHQLAAFGAAGPNPRCQEIVNGEVVRMKAYQFVYVYVLPVMFFILGFTYIILGGDTPVNQRTLGSSFMALGIGAILLAPVLVNFGSRLKEIERRLDNIEKNKPS